mgnify:CR=1 FL=1
MSIFRVEKKDNYVVLDKGFLKDKRLSWQAKGLLAYMLSMPNDWVFRIDDLKNRSTNGRDSTKNIIKELQENGYIIKEQTREKGKFSNNRYIVLEHPALPLTENPLTENPSTENPSTENPLTENPSLLNNKELNNNSLNNKEIDDDIGNDHAQSFQLIANRYIQRRGKGLSLSPKDETAIEKLLQEQIPLDDILKLIDQVFDEYEPKFNGDEIHSFEYVRKVLLSKYHEQKEGEGTDGGTIHKHRRGVSRSAKEGSKSYEQVLREAEAARRAWGWKG